MTAPIRRRTRAREIAMQILFQLDLRGVVHPAVASVDGAPAQGSSPRSPAQQNAVPAAAEHAQGGALPGDPASHLAHCQRELGCTPAQLCLEASEADAEVATFAVRLVEGTLEHLPAIDLRLQAVTRNWDLRRMANVDRNVLRMAIYELLFCQDVPPKVAINEAIELGKKYSTANSGGFVNGILDRVRIDIERERTAPAKSDKGELDATS